MNRLEQMRANPLVNVKHINEYPGVYACNFTHKAFYDKAWDAQTVTARGLFLDEDGNVVMRGYDKFFNIGEPHGYPTLDAFTAEAERDGLGYIYASRKANGYLGLIGARLGADGQPELMVFSKGGVTAFSRTTEDLLKAHMYRHAIDPLRLAVELYTMGVTMAVEVISDNDPHMINEGQPHLIMLDLIKNTETFEPVPLSAQWVFRRDFYFESTPCEIIAVDEPAELLRHVEQAERSRCEGLVMRYQDHDGNWRLTKFKTRYYNNAKAMRSVIASICRHGLDATKNRCAGSPYKSALLDLVVSMDLPFTESTKPNVVFNLDAYTIANPAGQDVIDMISILSSAPSGHPRVADALTELDVRH